MKINKESLGKIIETLQIRYDNLKEGENLDFTSINFNVKKDKYIPENWYLEKTDNILEQKIITNHFNKYITGYVWLDEWSKTYYPGKSFHNRDAKGLNNGYFGNSNIELVTNKWECELISFDDFVEYIVKPDINK